ncbi:hypothetical protein [Marinobacter salsuginis]|uniref:Uncharacterized protein n=1 Tax=Marinobacter salsuginis TaxID=418719 RepID=A0A5M3PNB9_9GAMM|nr:hypothetical protein [Marinobacter salsuginis]GBO84209.1 hypothetical protein MS5N3_16600 [Marinobacter salsuginis]
MGKRGKVGIVQRRISSLLVLVGLVAAWAVAGGVFAQSDNQENAFQYEERSTIHTIQLNSMEEETLANTVIEGGLTAPAAGVPLKPRVEDDFYLDPLGLRPGDSRTDLGRSQIPVEFRFSNPKSIPGQTHSNNYVIRPPENRTYDALNINMNER